MENKNHSILLFMFSMERKMFPISNNLYFFKNGWDFYCWVNSLILYINKLKSIYPYWFLFLLLFSILFFNDENLIVRIKTIRSNIYIPLWFIGNVSIWSTVFLCLMKGDPHVSCTWIIRDSYEND